MSASRSGRGFDPREAAGEASGGHNEAIPGPPFAVPRLLALRINVSVLKFRKLLMGISSGA
jgi:hypothetical protein